MVLVGYWPLNEDSGSTAYDYSGRGNDGNVSSGISLGSAGVAGSTGYDIPGSSDDQVVFPSYNNLFDGSNVYSISAWAKFRSFGTTRRFVWHPRNDFDVWVAVDSNQGGLHAGYYDGSQNAAAWGSGSTGNWYHIVMVWRPSGNQELWVNGDLKATHSTSNPNSVSNSNTWGARSDKTHAMDGLLSECRIYDHTLSPAEINYIYSVGKRGSFTSSKKTL